jgi:hypothetical protein
LGAYDAIGARLLLMQTVQQRRERETARSTSVFER